MTHVHIYKLLALGLAIVGMQVSATFSPITLQDLLQAQFQAMSSPPSESVSASFPVPNATRSFWMAAAPGVNPLAHTGSTGPLTPDAEICIIGSGITGVSVAYHLSKLFGDDATLPSQLSIVILEAREFC
jgi:hypothetical protein